MTCARRRLRRWLIPLLAGASVAACTGGDAAGPAGGPPTGSVAPPPAATLRWTSCPFPASPGAVVRAVAPGGDGAPWTAVGQEGGGGTEVRPAVWTSADGCGWRRAPVRAVTPDGERTGFSAVARRGRLVVALGRSYGRVHGNARPTLWRADGAAPLREVELLRELFGGESGISVNALASGRAAVLAAGAYITPGREVAVQVWRSGDGAGWTRLEPGAEQVSSRTEQLLPRDVATGPTGSLLVGTAFQPRDGGRDGFDAAAWYAAGDGRQWQRADLSGTGLVGPGDQRLLAAVRLGSGYVAVAAVLSGAEFGLRSVVSPDGRAWSAGGALPLGRGLPGADLPAAALTPGPSGAGVVAGTVAGGRAELWRSADGRSWRPETLPPAAGGTAAGVVLGGGPDRLALVVQTDAGPLGHLGR